MPFGNSAERLLTCYTICSYSIYHLCVSYAQNFCRLLHTHTHTHIYIYITRFPPHSLFPTDTGEAPEYPVTITRRPFHLQCPHFRHKVKTSLNFRNYKESTFTDSTEFSKIMILYFKRQHKRSQRRDRNNICIHRALVTFCACAGLASLANIGRDFLALALV
jgi:hypothetical protein